MGKQWTISGGYLFADATVLHFPANTALEGLLIPQVARHQLTFQIYYNNPALFHFGLQARASSAQFDDDQNRFRLGSQRRCTRLVCGYSYTVTISALSHQIEPLPNLLRKLRS